MPQEFYMAQACKNQVLEQCLNYGSLTTLYNLVPLLHVGNKKGVNRTSISTRSLDWVLGTFSLTKLYNYRFSC